MTEMSLDEAIVHAKEVACTKGKCDACGRQHFQLAAWLEELKTLRAEQAKKKEAEEKESTNK